MAGVGEAPNTAWGERCVPTSPQGLLLDALADRLQHCTGRRQDVGRGDYGALVRDDFRGLQFAARNSAHRDDRHGLGEIRRTENRPRGWRAR